MNPVFLIVLTAVCYGLYNFFIKVSSGSIHEILGAVILQGVSALLGGAALVVLHAKGTHFEVTRRGVEFAVLAGASVGLAEILSFYVFSRGVPVSIGTPAILAGLIVVGVVLGLLFLNESLSSVQALAVAMLVAGVVLLHVG